MQDTAAPLKTPVATESQTPAPVVPQQAPPQQAPKQTPVQTTSPQKSSNKSGGHSVISLVTIGLATLFFTLWVVEVRKAPTALMESSVEVAESMEAPEYILPELLPAVGSVELPAAKTTGTMSVEEAIFTRRSQRVFTDEALSLADVAQMLWSGQGVTDDKGHRAAPSARGLYPHTLYLVVRNVDGLEPGLYRYEPETHTLSDLGIADAGDKLSAAGVQENSQTAPAVIVVGTAVAKMLEMFPGSAQSVADLEAGHIGQNFYLQAQSAGLGTVVTAGFSSEAVTESLGLDPNMSITYLVPFGYPDTTPVEATH